MRKILGRHSVLLINVLVLGITLLAVEIAFRSYAALSGQAEPRDIGSSRHIAFQFYPYVMTGQASNTHYRLWGDVLHSRTLSVDVATNNFGFPNVQDFDIIRPYSKKPNEKIVLFTGGSTAFGVGATSNANITNEVLARILNAAQSDVHYTVISLAQGGWIAQQEAIALDIWGRLFNPDWVIALDGVNDTTVGCAMSQGTGNPVYFQLIDSLVSGYLGSQTAAVFYRGAWENQLIKHSFAYRALTGEKYIPPPAHLDHEFHDSLLQVTTPTLLSEIRRQVDFYILSEQSMLERFQDAKFILSSQPTSQDFAFELGDFYRDADGYAVDQAERRKFADGLDTWLQSFEPDKRLCSGESQTVGIATRYGFAMSAIRLAELAENYRGRQRRDVEYYNTGLLYPKGPAKRADYFIDTYHLNDAGQEYLARFYAHRILQRDFPDRDWSTMRPSAQWFK